MHSLLKKAAHGLALALVFTLVLFLDGHGQITETGSVANQNNKIAVRNKAFEIALIKTYYDNPMIYDVQRKALNGRGDAFMQSMRMILDEKSNYFNRIIPTTGVALFDFLGTSLGIKAADRKQAFNRELREEMDKNPEAVAEVARMIRETMYDPKAENRYVVDIYNISKSMEDQSTLPNAASYEALKQRYPEIVQSLEVQGLTDEQITRFCSGQMSNEEFRKAKNLQDDHEYKTYITNNFVTVLNAKKLPVRSDSELQRALDLKNHQKTVDEAYAGLYASSAVLSLFDKQAAYQISTAGNAAISIYDNVGRMSIVKTMDLKSFGNIVSAVGAVISLFGDNTDHTAEALNKILDAQREMFSRLDEIDIKVQKLQMSINYLLELTDYHHDEIIQKFAGIQREIADIKTSLHENQDFQRELMRQEKINDYLHRKNVLLSNFNNKKEIQDWYVQHSKVDRPVMEETTRKYFSNMDDLLVDMAVFATVDLENQNNLIFNDRSDVSKLDIPALEAKRTVDISQRMAMLPDMGKWLGKHLNSKPAPIVVKNSSANGDGLTKISVPNPQAFSVFLREYIDLALYRPVYKSGSRIEADPYVPAFCAGLHRIEMATKEMRLNVPLAIGALNFYLKQLRDRHERFIFDQGKKLLLTANRNEPILYSGISENDVTNILMQLSEEEFAALGEKINVLKKSQKKTVYNSFFGFRVKKPRYDLTDVRTTEVVTTTFLELLGPSTLGLYESKNEVVAIVSDEDYKALSTSTFSLPVDLKKRLPFAREIAQEIINRHHKIAMGWADQLKTNPVYYLEDIYRAKFVLETLVEGGYGVNYSYVPELHRLSANIEDANRVLAAINTRWLNGTEVLEDYPAGTFDKKVQISEVATTSNGSHVDDLSGGSSSIVDAPKNGTLLLFKEYFKNYGRFEWLGDTTSSIIHMAVVPAYFMPDKIQSKYLNGIGNLDAAQAAMNWASQYPDLKPPKGCYVDPDKKP